MMPLSRDHRWSAPLAALAIALVLGACSSADQRDSAVALRTMPVAYLTNRAESPEAAPKDRFGKARGRLAFGYAEVALAENDACVAPADTTAAPLTVKPVRKAGLASVSTLALPDFSRASAERLASASERSMLVYVHGFSRSFARGATDLAEVVCGTGFPGLPVLFSWPSQNTPAAYLADMTNVRWSGTDFREAMTALAAIENVDEIHVMAHSMGNQLLLGALLSAGAEERERWKLGEVVLIAPDIDRGRFLRDVAPVLTRVASRTTLYVSDVDIPLRASKTVNQAPRLGDAGAGIATTAGMETIDASAVSRLIDGHSYHRDSAVAQEDLHELLVLRRGASDRRHLLARDDGAQRYWELRSETP